MAQRTFTGAHADYTAPARRYFAITPHDSDNEANVFRGLYVGTTGDVVVVDEGDNATTFTAVPAGTVLPIIGKRVNSTNTTAENLVGLY